MKTTSPQACTFLTATRYRSQPGSMLNLLGARSLSRQHGDSVTQEFVKTDD